MSPLVISTGATPTLADFIARVRTDLFDAGQRVGDEPRWADSDLTRALDRSNDRYSSVGPYLKEVLIPTAPYMRLYAKPADAWFCDAAEYPVRPVAQVVAAGRRAQLGPGLATAFWDRPGFLRFGRRTIRRRLSLAVHIRRARRRRDDAIRAGGRHSDRRSGGHAFPPSRSLRSLGQEYVSYPAWRFDLHPCGERRRQPGRDKPS